MVSGINMLSLNMWLLPFGISADNNQRLEAIIQYVKKQDYDVICLQEVWLTSDVHKLRKQLSSYHIYWAGGRLFNRGGLVILSKEKGKAEFHRFQSRGTNLFETIAQKGFLRLQLSSGLKIINTHLDAYQKENAQKQLNQIITHNLSLSLICGDLNLETNDLNLSESDYSVVKTSPGIVDSNPYAHRRLNTFRKEKSIDHILNTKNLAVKGKTIKTEHFSDHLALEAEIL